MSTMHKGAKILALLAGGSIALAACSTGGDTPTASETSADGGAATKDITITVAHEQEFSAYNNGTSQDNAVKNTVVLNQVQTGFWEFGEDGTVQPIEEFGTYEKTSDDPLTVEYSINPDAVWSDGEAIDCDDIMLFWAANSGTYDQGETIMFDTASTAGVELMEKPTCEDGDKDFTIVYTDQYSDWIAGVSGILPAHVAEEQSGVEDIIAAVQEDDTASLQKVADFWNTGWRFNPGEIDEALVPSSGPYKIGAWEPGQSITLEANEEYWGTPAVAKTVIIRFIEQESQAQALQNGDIQIAEPQPNPDVISQLEAVGDQITVAQGDEFTYEHLDFNFAGAMADANLRRAFALCVPRDQIVESLIKPVNANAEVANSRFVYGFQPAYEDVVGAIYDGSYDTANIEEAKALVDAAGAAGTVVRIGYNTPNQRRTNEVDLIRASCNQAGFDVQDAGQADFFDAGLAGGNFDVALFAWSGSPLISGNSSIFTTGGGQNNGKYTNTEIDTLLPQLDVTPDPDEQVELIKQIEKILWDDLATIPIFYFPGVVAYDNTVENVTFQPSQSQVTWNMQKWDLAQ
ncbi:ABC transporter family substrate-binding protein [Angustibacter speluncae]